MLRHDALRVSHPLGLFGVCRVVYKARNRETKQMVALKCIKMENEKEGFPITAMREIKVLQRVHHTNIVGLLEVITSNGKISTSSMGLRARVAFIFIVYIFFIIKTSVS